MKLKIYKQRMLLSFQFLGKHHLVMLTQGGQYRGGSHYSVDKKCFLLFGAAHLITLTNQTHISETKIQNRETFRILKNTPHLLRFSRYSLFFEHFSKNYLKTLNPHLRSIKNKTS